jgi:5-methylthioadenosine/S-adenosylhomocysteine deaminase
MSHATKTSQRYLIKGGFLYAADIANTVIPNSWILVTDDKITAIGNAELPVPEYDQLINAEGKLVLPGLVNPHWHESFVAPNHEQPDDSTLEITPYACGGNIEALSSMFAFISTVGQKLTLEEGTAIARWSMWTQLRSGTTALGDLGSANTANAMGQAALDLGIRLRVSRWGSDIMIPAGARGFKRIADTQAQADDWAALMETWNDHPSGLIGGMPSVMGAFGSSDEQLIALRDIANRYQSPYATHLAPLRNEREAVQNVFGLSPIGRFDKFGLLTDRLLAVHTAYASEEEYQRLIATGVNICHSPAHYGMLGEATNSETKQIARFLKEGVPVSTSTDGDISFIGGMPEAMRAAHLCHNEANNDNTCCSPTLALRTGTLHGAQALGWKDRIGSIEVGKQADIVLIDIDDWRYRLGNHPLRTFLVAGGSKDVDTVMIAGKILIQQGRSTYFNEDELLSDYRKAVTSARKRIRKI